MNHKYNSEPTRLDQCFNTSQSNWNESVL